MAVFHVLKDGTRVDSIEGRIVKMADAKRLYAVIDTFTQKEKKKDA